MSCRVRTRNNKIQVPIPVKGSNPTYDGSTKTLSFRRLESDKVTITGNTGVNAGSYTATATLKDDSYIWTDGTTAPKTYSWAISKKYVYVYYYDPGTRKYNSEYQTPSIDGYDSSIMNYTGTMTAKDAGTYTVNFSLKDPNNYAWSGDSSITWTIKRYAVPGCTLRKGDGSASITAAAGEKLYMTLYVPHVFNNENAWTRIGAEWAGDAENNNCFSSKIYRSSSNNGKNYYFFNVSTSPKKNVKLSEYGYGGTTNLSYQTAAISFTFTS